MRVLKSLTAAKARNAADPALSWWRPSKDGHHESQPHG